MFLGITAEGQHELDRREREERDSFASIPSNVID